MNSIRFLSRGAMLAGLIVVLVACAPAQSSQATRTPLSSSTPPSSITPQPVLTANPTLTAPAPLGLAPQNCPSASNAMLTKRDTGHAHVTGRAPAWVNDFSGAAQHPLLLFGDNHSMYPWIQYDEHGWGHKFLYVVGPAYTDIVTFHGANVRDGTPLWLGTDETGGSTTTSLVLDPRDPKIVNRPGDWVEFPGGLDIPSAGCYYLEADWAGGSWSITFAAGV